MHVQSQEELISHLSDQINFLLSSAGSFDRGFLSEAKRMAVAIRILLHDTSKSSSLLGQLGRKNIYFYDTAKDYDPANLVSTPGLVMMKYSPKGGEYEAPLDAGPPTRYARGKVSFDRWWNRIVIADKKSNTFNRRDLILAVANKDGGAHVDPELDAAFAQLSRYNSLKWKFYSSDGIAKDFTNPELPSIRQITHEVLKSLRDEFGELFPIIEKSG